MKHISTLFFFLSLFFSQLQSMDQRRVIFGSVATAGAMVLSNVFRIGRLRGAMDQRVAQCEFQLQQLNTTVGDLNKAVYGDEQADEDSLERDGLAKISRENYFVSKFNFAQSYRLMDRIDAVERFLYSSLVQMATREEANQARVRRLEDAMRPKAVLLELLRQEVAQIKRRQPTEPLPTHERVAYSFQARSQRSQQLATKAAVLQVQNHLASLLFENSFAMMGMQDQRREESLEKYITRDEFNLSLGQARAHVATLAAMNSSLLQQLRTYESASQE